MPSFSLLGALEFRQVVASLQNQAASSSLSIFDSPHTPYAGGHYHQHPASRPRSRTVSHSDPWDSALGLPLHNRMQPPLLVTRRPTEEEEYHDDDEAEGFPRIPSPATSSQIISDADSESQQIIPQTRCQRIASFSAQVFHILCPSLHGFWSKSFLGKIVSILAVPAVLALTLTLPIVVIPYENNHTRREKLNGGLNGSEVGRLIDFEEEGIERTLIAEEEVQEELHDLTFNKWLMAAQCIFGPLFCMGILFSECRRSPMWYVYHRQSHFVFHPQCRWVEASHMAANRNGRKWIRGSRLGGSLRGQGRSCCITDVKVFNGISRGHSLDHGYRR